MEMEDTVKELISSLLYILIFIHCDPGCVKRSKTIFIGDSFFVKMRETLLSIRKRLI